LIGVYEGGIPEFNSDKSIETPTFLSKCEVNILRFRNQIIKRDLTNFISKDLDKIWQKLLTLRLKILNIIEWREIHLKR
jgi:hypothetical protein